MDFNIPQDIADYLAVLDDFIAKEIKPLEEENIKFFDHRREYERTDWDNDGAPKEEWEQLLREMKNRADKAGHLRWALPKELGGSGGSNLGMAIIREHLAHKGLGLHNDLQNESSIVGNFPVVHIFQAVGTQAQKDEFIEASITGKKRIAFGVTEPNHGSDATFMETEAKRDGNDWVINGTKRWNSGMSNASHDVVFARTSGEPGEPMGITAFIVPVETPGVDIAYMHWTFNMPSDHAEVHFRNVRVPNDAILHVEGRGLECMQAFFHENRIRQAASSLGAGQYCVDEAVKWANQRVTWGKPLSTNQAIQWPLAELNTEAEMLRNLVYKSAWHLDQQDHMSVTHWVAMANYRANRFVCEAADRAMQVHGGMGYTRYKPFEHIYRHHRRYRITEGTEEIQIRKVASSLFKKFRE
jgi:acyl-CoA dehydrogenase